MWSILLMLRPWMGYDYTVIQVVRWVELLEQRRLCPIFFENMIPINGTHDECKTHLCFEFISHVILRILYPSSCKTHNILSKLGFVELLMKSK